MPPAQPPSLPAPQRRFDLDLLVVGGVGRRWMAPARPPTQRARGWGDDEGVAEAALGWMRVGRGVPWTWRLRLSKKAVAQ